MKTTRRGAKALLVLALALSVMMTALPAMAVGQSTTLANAGDVYYTITGLNYRSSPANLGAANRIGTFSSGTAVTYQRTENGWWYVTSSYGSGWVDKQYLTRAPQSSTGTYYVTASALNVRYLPNTSSAVVGSLSRGSAVNVLALNGDWSKIGTNRWVASRYLSKSSSVSSYTSSGSSVSTGKSYTVRLSSGYLNVRSAASTGASVVGKLYAGASVYVDQVSGNWAHLSGKGWVYKTYLR